MTDDGLTPAQRAFLASREHAEAFSEMSAQDINRMSFEDFARRTGRPSLTQSAIAALDTQQAVPQTPQPQQPSPVVPDAGQPVDVAGMTWQEYAQYREQSGLAARSEEGMSRASLSMTDRWVRDDIPVNGRRTYYR